MESKVKKLDALTPWAKLRNDQDLRDRLGKLRVLLADRDQRTASLVHRILYSFGFRKVDMALSGEHALRLLYGVRYDLIITEWHMAPISGLELVHAIRRAKDDDRLARDIPIIMLTAFSEAENVQAARDAGISEFLRKPFSAKTVSDRIIQVIDSPRAFVDAPGFVGPDRRRRADPPNGHERRTPRKKEANNIYANVVISPPNDAIRQQLDGVKASEILTENVVAEAQQELVKAESEFISWAADDVQYLEDAYRLLEQNLNNMDAQVDLREVAYRIKSQAGVFGFDIGTEVAGLLVRFLGSYTLMDKDGLLILRKHIDAIKVIFNQKIKGNGEQIGRELITSLNKLIEKLG